MVRPGQEIVNTYEHIVTNEARITSDGPLEAGSTIVYRGTFLGRHYDTHVECTGLTENKHFATRTTSGPFYLETDAVLESVAEGTRVTTTTRSSRTQYRGGGWPALGQSLAMAQPAQAGSLRRQTVWPWRRSSW